MQGMEKRAQLSEQETKFLKKDQIARSVSLVPKFYEEEIEKYFLIFEKVAKNMDWVFFVFAKCVSRKGQGCVVCSANFSLF